MLTENNVRSDNSKAKAVYVLGKTTQLPETFFFQRTESLDELQ